MKYVLTLLIPFIMHSCSANSHQKVAQSDAPGKETIDSTLIKKNEYGDYIKYTFYGEDGKTVDSIRTYYKTSNALESISFYGKKDPETGYQIYPDNIGDIFYFEDGTVKAIQFIKEYFQKGDTSYISYYPGGQTEMLSTIEQDSAYYPLRITFFHPNGQKREEGLNDEYQVWGMPVGTWHTYDSEGSLIETTFYHPDESGKDYMIVKEYDKGKLISTKIYNNYVQYESDPVELDKIPE